MDILEPSWNAKNQYYSFLLVNAPLWIQKTDSTAPAPSIVEDLSGLLTTFLQRSEEYFMTPLTWENLEKTLEHVWLGWKEHMDANPPADKRPPAQITWKPTEIRVSSDSQKLVWQIHAKEVPPVRIPPGFGQPPPVRTVTVVSPEQESLISDYGMGLLEAADDIPYDESEIREGAGTASALERAEHRKRVRQARLRAAMARLRAERLSQKYFDKYGEMENEDDSPLSSSDSDFGKI